MLDKIKNDYFKKVGEILEEINEINACVIENHLLYSDNCGEDYLPSKRVGKEFQPGVFFGSSIEKDEEKVLEDIVQKLVPNMNIVQRQYSYNLLLDNQKMIESLDNSLVTNFWFGKSTDL